MFTAGIDLGSRTAKALLYSPEDRRVVASIYKDISTDVKDDAKILFQALLDQVGALSSDIDYTISTGYGRSQAVFANDTSTEITCHAIGVHLLFPDVRTIIDIGGQDSKAIHLSEEGFVRDFSMNDRCAAGTGRFLEVVAKILGTDVKGLVQLASLAKDIPEISSMCVVFAESEVVGMLARGIPPADLAAGIHRSIARRVAGLAERGRLEPPVIFTGGVAQNQAMARALGQELHERIRVPKDPRITGALGAAIMAARHIGFPGGIDTALPETLHFGGKQEQFTIPEERTNAILIEPINIETTSSCCSSPKAEEICCGSQVKTEICNQSSKPEPACSEKQSSCGCENSVCEFDDNPSNEKDENTCECNSKPASHLPVGAFSVPSLTRFDRMVQNSIDYARSAKQQGKKIVSIFCEYTPREIIMAAGAVPVCACGGSHTMAVVSEKELPANLCPLIKSSYGYAIEHANPIFEISDLVVAETTCDGKKKMYEVLNRFKPIHILELTQKPDVDTAYKHWLDEIKVLKKRIEELTGVEITDERLRDAIKLMNKERKLRAKIAEFAGKPLSGSEILMAKSLIACIPEDLAAYEQIISECGKLSANMSKKPRILLTGVPLPHGAEKVLTLLEQAGAVVVAQENCTGLKPLVELVDEQGDPTEAIAKKYFHLPCSCMMPNMGRFELIDQLVKEYKPQGIIDLVWQACHTYNVESVLLKKHITDDLKMPFMKIETDYSPSDTEQLRLRIESFLSVVESRQS